MESKRLVLFTAISSICIIAAIVIILVSLSTTADTPEVHLPVETHGISSDVNNEGMGMGELNELNYAALRPDTVQYILKIIEQPKSYSCKYAIESFWDDGSGYFDVSVYVKDEIYSVMILNDAYLKRCIFTDEKFYIWYIGEEDYYEGNRRSVLGEEKITDAVQMSGSYKSLMELDPEQIIETDYIDVDGVYCIYVKAKMGQFGYISEYYIYPDTGLLLKNEIYDGDKLVYRMSSSDMMLTAPYDEYFTLPGGKVVS